MSKTKTPSHTSWVMAELPTRNFTFEALGDSQVAALESLKAGLAVHAAQYKLAPDWFDEEDIVFRDFTVGVCQRDGEPLPVQAHLMAPATPNVPMVSIQQAWEWAGGNPAIPATIIDLKIALNVLDQVCDESDVTPTPHPKG